jgi:hypothetical protein
MVMLHGVTGWTVLCGMDVQEVHGGRWYGVFGRLGIFWGMRCHKLWELQG